MLSVHYLKVISYVCYAVAKRYNATVYDDLGG